jgi:ABC-2 type transport system permease protein
VLWYKAWLETRARFLTLLATVTAVCGFFIYHALGGLDPGWKLERDFDRLLLVDQQILVFLWIFGVVLLGMGGIVREKAIGTSSFTLALPVSRARLVGVRVGLGIIEAVALGVVPWTAVFIVSSLAGMPILITQVGLYLLLLVGGGLVYFAAAVLVSSLVSGEYTAPSVAFGAILLPTILGDPYLPLCLNNRRLVTGAFSVDTITFHLSGHLPWLGILASLSAAGLLLWASIMVVQRREF